MTLFALRHKPTGGYLPEKKGSGMRRGFTHSEPSTVEPPRLFRKKGDARMALRAWLEGTWTPGYVGQHPDGTSKHVVSIQYVPERQSDEWEIVEIDFLILNREDWT